MKEKSQIYKTRWMHLALLFRTPNLLVIALTMILTHYTLLKPLLGISNEFILINELYFYTLVISGILAAAAGYAINDYFDIRVDRINRPLKVVVGRFIARRKVILIHLAFSITSFLLSLIIAILLSSYKIAIISLLVNTLLWFYSAYYKPVFLFGNLIVALCTAFYSIYIVWVLDAELYSNALNVERINFIGTIIWIYSLFAFLITVLREIIKDIEDMVGDEKCGCKTIPIVIGIKYTKIILVFIILIIMSLLGAALYNLNADKHFYNLQVFIVAALILPFFYIFYSIIKATKAHQFSNISKNLKIIIVLGILSMLFFSF